MPPPYYSYYSSPPVGAVVLMVAGVAYLMSKDGSYSKQTTSSEGKVVYQSVPAPEGASLKTLPAERVLVTVSGTTYYLYSNAFYRRVLSGAQESFVVVTAPAGVVFEGTLPAVPTNTPLRLYGRDIGMCCVDSCNYPPVLEDILLNGTKLTKVVHDGLPSGLTAALEFTVTGSGTIQN